MYHLNRNADKRFIELLFHSIDRREYNKEIKRNDVSNVIRADIFILFSKVKILIIHSTFAAGSFSFSLIAFLSVIDETNLDEIIIKSEWYYGFNWIKSLWESHKKRLKSAYAAKNYKIEMEMIKDEYRDQYNLQITKF